MHTRLFLSFFFFTVFFFLFSIRVSAAELILKPDISDLGVGQKFTVSVDINTGSTPINAAQAVISFPTNLLHVTDVSLSGSIFRFWVELPEASNEKGTVTFVGGTSQEVTGGAAHLLTVEFQTKGVGTGSINASDVVITAGDGEGTNVFSGVQNASIQIGGQIVPGVPLEGGGGPPSSFVETPQPVRRDPTPSSKLPADPKLRVSLYPQAEEWYNYQGELVVLWDVPSDVTSIATAIDKNPNTDPKTTEKELFTGKNFGILDEGVWYTHVQFKNNVGWGRAVHQRIAIDVTPPVSFKARIDNAKSDNPTPGISFDTQDSLSGLAYGILFVDGREALRSTSTVATLPIQAPGIHTLLVRVFDEAGNTSEDSLSFEIMPLPTPVISFITTSVSQEEPIYISGEAIKNGRVDIVMYNDRGQEVFSGGANTDGFGKWNFSIEASLAGGSYTVSVEARDAHGAKSFPEEISGIKVKPRTVIAFGAIELDWFEIFIITLLLIIFVASSFSWYVLRVERRRRAYTTVASGDVGKLTELLGADLNNLESYMTDPYKRNASNAETEIAYLFRRTRGTIQDMKRYISEEINKLE